MHGILFHKKNFGDSFKRLDRVWKTSWTTRGWQGVYRVKLEIGLRYKNSEVAQLPTLLTMWGHYLSRYI